MKPSSSLRYKIDAHNSSERLSSQFESWLDSEKANGRSELAAHQQSSSAPYLCLAN
jgi:hypothetical protein